MADVYCAFCGVILFPDPYVAAGATGPETPPRRQRPWYSEVRGLTAIDNPDTPTLTGVGLVYRSNHLSAPDGSHSTYLDHQLSREWGLSRTRWRSWAFGVHDACWQVLRLRLGRLPESHIVSSVFRLLLCVPCIGLSWFDFGHDYGGASVAHKTQGRFLSIVQGSLLYADPCALPSLDVSEKKEPLPSTFYGYADGASYQAFGPLSTELIHEVLSYLSCKEVAALRLVNRTFSSIAAVENLPQSYWRSRFLLGQEADFVFPGLGERRDWRGLLFGLKRRLQDDGNIFLLNRRRIRGLIESIARIVEEGAVAQPGLYGVAALKVPNQEARFQLLGSDNNAETAGVLERSSSFSGYITSTGENAPLSYGCRLLNHRTQRLPYLRQNDDSRIAVSTCHIGAITFISGIGIFPSPMSEESAYIIGYNHIRTATWLQMPTASSIEHIQVAFSAQGLTGVMFSFTNGTSSRWTGISEGPGIAQGCLRAAGKSQPRHLLAGVDCFKIVSLGVYTPMNDQSSQSETPPEIRASHPQSHLWFPSPPAHDGLQLTPLYPSMEPLPFQPLLSIDFGGPGGLYLSELTGIVCYMGYDPHPLLGMQAVYADGRSALFGSRRGCEVYFAIAGPDGERITEVSVLNDVNDLIQTVYRRTVSKGVCGLQFTTNYGRTAHFATIQSRLKNNLDTIQTPGFNHIITGLAVRQMPSKDSFIRVALQCQPFAASDLPKQRSLLPPEPEVCKASLEHDKQFSRLIRAPRAGDYQTHASLKGVRRIQASIGTEDRCRSSSQISGLRLFYNNGAPVILGQWMEEYRTIDLLPDEDIEYLAIWILPAEGSVEWRPARQGQVVAVRFDTTQSRHITFDAPGGDSIKLESLRMQYGHGDAYTLTDIFWIMNSSYDRVRATGSETFGRSSKLVPDQYPLGDEVQRLYFDRMEHRGSSDPVATARAWICNGQLLGLAFKYMSGVTVRVGEFHTDSGNIENVHFPENCRFLGIATGIKDAQIRVLKFELEDRNTLSGEKYRTMGFGLPSSDEDQILSECDWQHVWPNPEQSEQSAGQPLIREKTHPPPTGMRLAGLYFNCQDFASVGGLYEHMGREVRGGTV